jgi:hypothetical protein
MTRKALTGNFSDASSAAAVVFGVHFPLSPDLLGFANRICRNEIQVCKRACRIELYNLTAEEIAIIENRIK